jgi:hypothetical protein
MKQLLKSMYFGWNTTGSFPLSEVIALLPQAHSTLVIWEGSEQLAFSSQSSGNLFRRYTGVNLSIYKMVAAKATRTNFHHRGQLQESFKPSP